MEESISFKSDDNRIVKVVFDASDDHISYYGVIYTSACYYSGILTKRLAVDMLNDNQHGLAAKNFDFRIIGDHIAEIKYDSMALLAKEVREVVINHTSNLDAKTREELLRILDDWDKYDLTDLEDNNELIHLLARHMIDARTFLPKDTKTLAKEVLNEY